MTPEQIIKARHNAGLTQTQAASLVGVSLRTWQNWEAGVHKMPVSAAKLFELSVKSPAV